MLARTAALKASAARQWRDVPVALFATNTGTAPQLAPQRHINWYPVRPEAEGDDWQAHGTPGTTLLGTLDRDDQRGWHIHGGRLFIVAGARVYEAYADGTSFDWGKINSVRGRVVMASLLNVIVIGDGAGFYALDLTAGTVTAIADAPRGRFCVFFNQRILYQGENGQVFYSELNDATDIPGLNFFSAESLPDEIVAITTTEDRIGLHGDDSTEWHFDSGNADNPIARIPGGVTYIGCQHPFTAIRLDNSIWMVGRDKEGANVVWRSQGTDFVKVSDGATERFLAASEVVTAYSYQEEGKAFLMLNSEIGTRGFQIGANQWHDRGWLNSASGAQERQRQEFCAFVYGVHMVGDYANGKIYRMGLDLRTDAGDEIRRTIVAKEVSANGNQITVGALRLDFATGVGLDGEGQGVDPVVMVRAAPEGVSFGLERTESLGAIGEFDAQVLFYDFGVGRKWVFEISVSDPVFTAIRSASARINIGGR
jgi:hypothetical protein